MLNNFFCWAVTPGSHPAAPFEWSYTSTRGLRAGKWAREFCANARPRVALCRSSCRFFSCATCCAPHHHRFEPGALGQLSRAVNLTQLHLEVLPDSSSSAPISPSATAAGGPSKSPSELARLQAADEVGLAKMGGQLLSCTAIGFSTASSIRPITALLAAVAGSPKPHMAELQLGAQEVSSQSISLIASISSLSCLKLLPGCELASPLDLARLSTLAGLTQLLVAPCMPPAPVLTAWAKGCKRLASLGVCAQPGPLPLMPAMTGITDLQLLSSSTSRSRYGGSSNGGTGSGSSSPTRLSVDLGSLAVTLRSPLSLSGLDTLWPRLVSLEVVGWALDAGSMSAIKQLDTLSSIKLQGGREPGTALHARLLLPLLDKPGLRRLLLLEVSDLSDAWVSEAMMRVTGPCADGSLPAVSELHLGAAADTTPAPSAANGGGSSSNGSSSGVANLRASFSGNSGLAGSSSGDGGLSGSQGSRQMLTDKGLVRLVAWPRLTKLVLVGLPDITLAGVKALVAGSNSLSELTVKACPAVSAAPPDSIARAALGPGAKAVDLWVS